MSSNSAFVMLMVFAFVCIYRIEKLPVFMIALQGFTLSVLSAIEVLPIRATFLLAGLLVVVEIASYLQAEKQAISKRKAR